MRSSGRFLTHSRAAWVVVILLLYTVAYLFIEPLFVSVPMEDHSAHAHMHKMDDGDDGGMTMMPMFFQLTMETVLWIQSWSTHTPLQYVASIVGLAAFTLLHEALSGFRVAYIAGGRPPAALEGYLPLGDDTSRSPLSRHLVASVLYALNTATSYLLMLAVMTYNVGYFITVVLAMGLGHFLFSRKATQMGLLRQDPCCDVPIDS